MPKTLIDAKKKAITVRFSERMIERINAVLDGEHFGEFVRLATLRQLEIREQHKGEKNNG